MNPTATMASLAETALVIAQSHDLPCNIAAGFPACTRGLATVVARLPQGLNTSRGVEIVADELLKRAWPMR
jgi:hypothetical protein